MAVTVKRVARFALLALFGAATTAFALRGEEPAHTRFGGAYLMDDGAMAFVTPRDADVLRIRRVGRLHRPSEFRSRPARLRRAAAR